VFRCDVVIAGLLRVSLDNVKSYALGKLLTIAIQNNENQCMIRILGIL
jgi:hypothetical protein